MPETYIIHGGKPLSGEVTPIPNKNALVCAIPAALLTAEEVTFHNLPDTSDVTKLLQMAELIGTAITNETSKTTIQANNLTSYEIDSTLGGAIRSSIVFAGPLLTRFGKARIPLPGGCVLGKRSIHAHIDAFMKVGVTVEVTGGWAEFTKPSSLQKDYFVWLAEASVTATENLIMYCAGTDASFEIVNAATEPHVGQLLELIKSMGAQVEGIGSNRIFIKGSSKLNGASFTAEPDFVDIVGLISAAGITKGKFLIKGINDEKKFGGIFQTFKKFSIQLNHKGQDIEVDASRGLYIDLQASGIPMAGHDLPKFIAQPWPGFPVDGLPAVLALACKLPGKMMFMNWMYETGLEFVREINSIGGNIYYSDPHRVIVNGPVTFTGGRVTTPSIIQACKALFLCALADDVKTVLEGAQILKRRYPNVVEVYKSLGANIEEVQ